MFKLGRVVLVIAALGAVACSADQESVEDSSEVTYREGRNIAVTLDGADYLLRDRSEFVTVAFSYPSAGPSSLTFTREELAAGAKSKSHLLREDAGTPTCSYHWAIASIEGRPLMTSTTAFQSGGGIAVKGSCAVSTAGVTLRLPWEMSSVEIERAPDALTNHDALLLMGKLYVPGTVINGASPDHFSFMANKPEHTRWTVDVFGPSAPRTVKLTWIRRGAPKEETEIVTSGNVVRIE